MTRRIIRRLWPAPQFFFLHEGVHGCERYRKAHNLYYVKSCVAIIHDMRFKKYQRIETAERLLKWMLCVPKLRTNSPRFAYYADNWNVLEKIRRFVESGEFASIVKDCPAFSSEELRAALDILTDPTRPTSRAILQPHPTQRKKLKKPHHQPLLTFPAAPTPNVKEKSPRRISPRSTTPPTR